MIITNGVERWWFIEGTSNNALLKQIGGKLLKDINCKEYSDWWEEMDTKHLNNVIIDNKRYLIEETGLDGVSFVYAPSLNDFDTKRLLVPPEAKSWRSLADIFPTKEKIVILGSVDVDMAWWNRENCE